MRMRVELQRRPAPGLRSNSTFRSSANYWNNGEEGEIVAAGGLVAGFCHAEADAPVFFCIHHTPACRWGGGREGRRWNPSGLVEAQERGGSVGFDDHEHTRIRRRALDVFEGIEVVVLARVANQRPFFKFDGLLDVGLEPTVCCRGGRSDRMMGAGPVEVEPDVSWFIMKAETQTWQRCRR